VRIRDRHGRIGPGASQSRHEAARSSTQFASYWTWPRRPRPRLGPSRAVIRILGSGASQRAHRRTNRDALQIASSRRRCSAANGYCAPALRKDQPTIGNRPRIAKTLRHPVFRSRSFTPRCGNRAPRLASSFRIGSAGHPPFSGGVRHCGFTWANLHPLGSGAARPIRKRSIIARPKNPAGLPPPPEPTPQPCDIEQSAVFLYSCRFTSRRTSRSEASEHRDQPFDRPAWGHVS
jgi:hypothetical protein